MQFYIDSIFIIETWKEFNLSITSGQALLQYLLQHNETEVFLSVTITIQTFKSSLGNT